jgi:hypothetical protein
LNHEISEINTNIKFHKDLSKPIPENLDHIKYEKLDLKVDVNYEIEFSLSADSKQELKVLDDEI